MAYKRPSEALAVVPDVKRSRNELIAITNRDKALLEAVSVMRLQQFKHHSEQLHYFYSHLAGSSAYIKSAIANYVARRS